MFIEQQEYNSLTNLCNSVVLARHAPNTESCTLYTSKYHMLIYHAGINALWALLSPLEFCYHIADDVYAYYRFSVRNNCIEQHGDVIDQLSRASKSNPSTAKVEDRPSVFRQRIIQDKKLRTHNISGKDVAVQTTSRGFDARLAPVMTGPLSGDCLKMIDCLCHGEGYIKNDRIQCYMKYIYFRPALFSW